MAVKGERCRHLIRKAVWFRGVAGAQSPPGHGKVGSVVIGMPRAQSFAHPLRHLQKLRRVADVERALPG